MPQDCIHTSPSYPNLRTLAILTLTGSLHNSPPPPILVNKILTQKKIFMSNKTAKVWSYYHSCNNYSSNNFISHDGNKKPSLPKKLSKPVLKAPTRRVVRPDQITCNICRLHFFDPIYSFTFNPFKPKMFVQSSILFGNLHTSP